MVGIIAGGLGSYLLLCLLIAKLKFDTPPWGPKLIVRFYEEAMTGFILYPFNICYWVFRLVARLGIKLNKKLNKWLDKVT